MVMVYAIDGITPVVHADAFVHPTASLIGDVIVGAGVFIGPGASLRGDFGRVVVEEGSNIQDNCVVHGFPGQDTVIEAESHIGHGAIIHTAHICRNALIGMHAVIGDNAEIGESAFVGALAFVKAGMKVPPRTLATGIPAKIIRDLTEKELTWKREATRHYQRLAVRCRESLRPTEALTEVEPDRKRFAAASVVPLGTYRKQTAS